MPEHTPAPTPSRAVYGFALFLSFKMFFIIYLLWAFIPEEYFESLRITFLPQRYWAITIPIYFLTVLTMFAFFIYPSLGLLMTPNIDDIKTINDKVGSLRKMNGSHIKLKSFCDGDCICKRKEKCYKEYYELKEANSVDKSIPKLQDLDICKVSEYLYLK